MIISASRRTDIPALYGEWFMNRLQAGSVLVPNPRFTHRLSKVSLSTDEVDCIVFWTKNPIPFLGYIEQLKAAGYCFYFEYTLNPYNRSVEPNLPDKQPLIQAFQELSGRIGKSGVDWRYDPILLTEDYTIADHLLAFADLCRELAPFTERCVLSFVDSYSHLDQSVRQLTPAEIDCIAKQFAKIAELHHLPLYSCAETIDLDGYGIRHGACIDAAKIEQITGHAIKARKDRGQRTACRCVQSTDIGIYDTCIHGCIYCYATRRKQIAMEHYRHHDVNAPMLTGYPNEET